jgi:hypothetical protein
VPTDFVELLRQADEAGDLGGVANILALEAQGSDAGDLRELTAHHQAWRGAIAEWLDREQKSLAE